MEKFNVKEFENINSFAARQRYAQEHLKRIASGSARIVYEIDQTKVLKLAKNQKGIAQNEAEISMGMNDYYAKDVVANVFDADEENSTWLIAEKAKKLTPSRFYQITGVNIKDLAHWLMYNSNKGYSNVSPEMDEYLWDNEFSSIIIDFMKTYDMPAGDLTRISSYGEVVRNGQPDVVVTDYGLTKDVFSTHYARRFGEADTNMEDELTNFVVDREIWDGGYGGFALQPQKVGENIDFIYEAKIETNVGWFDIDERLSPQQNELFISHLEVFDKGRGHFKQLLNDIEEFGSEHGKDAIILEPDITQGREYREFLENLYKKHGFTPYDGDPSLLVKKIGVASLMDGVTDNLKTPISKVFSYVNEFEDYRNIGVDFLQNAVQYVENFNKLRGNLSSHISDLYKNYLINVQNYKKGLELATNDIEYYNNLMKIQEFLSKFGLVKEDLTYSHVNDASPDSDKYYIGENGTSLYMTQHGSDGSLKGDDLDEDQTLVKTDELKDVILTIKDVFGIVSPHQLTNNKINNAFSEALKNLLDKFNFEYYVGIGEWDDNANTHEQSFIIKKPNNLSKKNFIRTMKLISKKFFQKAFIIGENGKAFLCYKDGGVEEIGTDIELTNNNYIGFDFIDEEVINEAGAGINRLFQHMRNNAFAIMSANRNENDIQQNKAANQNLSKELQSKQAGFVPLIGHWEEIKVGTTKEAVNVREQSFFIPKPANMEVEEFKEWIIDLGKEFSQEAVLIGIPEEGATLYYMNGSVEKKGQPNLLNINQAYSQLRKKPDATFVFEDRIKTWMPKMKEPVIKKSCRLGGKGDGTSEACGQGDTGAVSYKNITDGQSHKPNDLNIAEEELNESLLTEEKINYGVLMANFDIPNWNKIINKIKESDLYDDGSGTFLREESPHITILYGFHSNVTGNDFKEIIENIDKPIEAEINGISIFENNEFDVVKLDVKPSEELINLRKKVVTFPVTLTYKDYKPHMTLAYVKKGEGKKYVYDFEKPIKITSDLLVFSDKEKNETQFPLK